MIGFLQPWALLGLPLVALPLLLHLIQRRDPPSVVFPAVRYLRQVSEEHQRRLRIRHLLLLLVRTSLVLLLVLAAAAPTMRGGTAAGHAPVALVIVLDNSASSGAVAGGTPVLAGLRTAARRVLAQATAADRLWLMTADGVTRRGLPADLQAAVDSVLVDDRRLDLGEAITEGEGVLDGDPGPGGILVISDLQSSALSPVRSRFPVIAARPPAPPPANSGIGAVETGPQPWSSGGGAVIARVIGTETALVPIAVSAGGRFSRNGVARAGAGMVPVSGLPPGWWPIAVAKPPDEFRADDERSALVHVVEPARVSCAGLERHLSTACVVLTESGRIRPGDAVSLEQLGAGSSIVTPPDDPAGLGALNRALERRGSGWRYGAHSAAETVSDSGALVGRERISRRVELIPARPGLSGGVVATAAGRPWIVQSGNLILLGSRLEPAWTGLPLSAAFPGFVDALVNRVVRGDMPQLAAHPGDPVVLPAQATAVAKGDHRWPVEGGAAFRARETGVYFVLAGRDTIGGLSVGIDPRESALERPGDDVVAGIWPGGRVVELGEAADAAFAAAASRNLQAALLWLAVVLAGCEVVLASGRRRTA